MKTLTSPYQLGPTELKNRVVMAPMTRNRAAGNVPASFAPKYYAQRSEAGLIVTEGTSPSPNGLGYPRIPGLFTKEQADAWKHVVDAVHKEGSRIFVQLMHTGRVGHPLNLPKGAKVLGPSAIAAPGEIYTDAKGNQPIPKPEAMSEDDIETAIHEYAKASALAIKVGFDGVELHGANGYLIEQFLNLAANQRTDAWGGDVVQARSHFALEVARRVVAEIGPERVGMRLSPYGVFNGMTPDPLTDALYIGLARRLADLGLVYLHLVDHSSMGAPKPKEELVREMRANFRGTFIVSGGFDAERAEEALVTKRGDLVAFGRPFLANPRLVTKFKKKQSLRVPDAATFYTPGEKGYTDYPLE